MSHQPTNYNFTDTEGSERLLREIDIMPSTPETVDFALYNWLNETINLHAEGSEGWKKVPVIWEGSERAYQIKTNNAIRDEHGALNLPIITVARESMEKDPEFKGVAWAHLAQNSDEKGGVIVVARRIQQNKTSEFANADASRRRGTLTNPVVGPGQPTFPRRNKKVVYETISMPIPTYVRMTYKINLKAAYQQQMNAMVTPFMVRTGQINNFFVTYDGHRFEGFIDGAPTYSNNTKEMAEDERKYETEVSVKILGYLLREDKNDPRPKISVRENAVEIRMPRERIVFGGFE